MIEYIDTHMHLTDSAYAPVEESLLIERALSAGVTRMMLADIDSSGREEMYAAAGRHPQVLFPMLGLYPGSVGQNWRDEIDAMIPYLDRKPVAVGEIGLDYHYGRETAELQKEAFCAQLSLAAQWDLPVNIHLREATDDFFDIMESVRHLGLRGNIHAFSGSYETFRRLQKYGHWYVGIGGVVTFKKAALADVVRLIPPEYILLETDAPYLAPTPLRGTRNESANIPIIASFIATAKGLSLEEMASRTTANALCLFSTLPSTGNREGDR